MHELKNHIDFINLEAKSTISKYKVLMSMIKYTYRFNPGRNMDSMINENLISDKCLRHSAEDLRPSSNMQ